MRLHGRGARDAGELRYWIEQSFHPWHEEAIRALEAAQAAYRAVFEEGVPEWQVAAAARVGDLHRAMADTIGGLPVDPSISRDLELSRAYREALEDAASPMREAAIASYQRCVDEAARYNIADGRSRGCEQALHDLASSAPPGAR